MRQAYKRAAEIHFEPDMAPYLPGASLLFYLPYFKKYIGNPQDVLGDLPVEDTRKRILCYTNSVITDLTRQLTKALEDADIDSGNEKPCAVSDLATAVFECQCPGSTTVYIGWEDIKIEDCMEKCTKALTKSSDDGLDLRSHFHHSATGYLALQHLAQLLDLDLRTIKAKDLDAMNKRFFCKHCSLKSDRYGYGLEAMTWRECVRILNLYTKRSRLPLISLILYITGSLVMRSMTLDTTNLK